MGHFVTQVDNVLNIGDIISGMFSLPREADKFDCSLNVENVITPSNESIMSCLTMPLMDAISSDSFLW